MESFQLKNVSKNTLSNFTAVSQKLVWWNSFNYIKIIFHWIVLYLNWRI